MSAPGGRPRLLIVVGTTRPTRFADKLLAWVLDRLATTTRFELEVLDLRDHPLPFFDAAVSPARAQGRYDQPDVAALAAIVERADGFLVITGEYNHGYPAVLKNALDHLFVEFNRKPVAFVGYGNAGGARAIEQLRQVVVELEMAPLRYAVHVGPETMRAILVAEEFSVDDLASSDERLAMVVDDLLWWTGALAAARSAGS